MFEILAGVLQGDTLASCLFVIVLEEDLVFQLMKIMSRILRVKPIIDIARFIKRS